MLNRKIKAIASNCLEMSHSCKLANSLSDLTIVYVGSQVCENLLLRIGLYKGNDQSFIPKVITNSLAHVGVVHEGHNIAI